MLNSLLSSLQSSHSGSRGSRGAVDKQAREQQRDQFNRHLTQDAQAVVFKLLGGLDKELKQVVDEMVLQADEFWQHQVHALEESHKEEVCQLRAELVEAGKQLDETVTRYNQVVKTLNSQLAEAHEAADAAKRVAEAKAAAAQQQSSQSVLDREVSSSSYKAQLQDLGKQLAAAQAAARDADLRAQNKRHVLVQTVEQQHKEIEDLKQKLKTAEARDAQLTRVSEHLLTKQARLVKQIKELQAQLPHVEVPSSPTAQVPNAVDAGLSAHTPTGVHDLLASQETNASGADANFGVQQSLASQSSVEILSSGRLGCKDKLGLDSITGNSTAVPGFPAPTLDSTVMHHAGSSPEASPEHEHPCT